LLSDRHPLLRDLRRSAARTATSVDTPPIDASSSTLNFVPHPVPLSSVKDVGGMDTPPTAASSFIRNFDRLPV
jgi:hypothetical protein